MEKDANSVDTTVENVQDTNSQESIQGTQETENSTNSFQEVAPAIDYQKKFSESSKEALRIREENKELKRQLELRDNYVQETVQNTDNLYPGFENLDDDSKENIIAYTEAVSRKAAEKLKKDPAYAFSIKQYNEQLFNSALNKTIEKYPELANNKDDFRNKYYDVSNVPPNIENILGDIAKIYLFDKAKEVGARETEEKSKRFELERANASSHEPVASRTLEDWARLQQENPAKFASMREQYKKDLDSGKI